MVKKLQALLKDKTALRHIFHDIGAAIAAGYALYKALQEAGIV